MAFAAYGKLQPELFPLVREAMVCSHGQLKGAIGYGPRVMRTEVPGFGTRVDDQLLGRL